MIKRLFEEHKFMRRLTLVWAVVLITIVVMRVTEFEALVIANGSIVAIVTAVIGILATVIGFYQWSRNKDDDPSDS